MSSLMILLRRGKSGLETCLSAPTRSPLARRASVMSEEKRMTGMFRMLVSLRICAVRLCPSMSGISISEMTSWISSVTQCSVPAN